ncbi:anti-sigma factor (TIGR02949 family) [Streptomyces zagrosensis]|uniref:Anti-sigma factor (TIGR02949 family) n=1 Tax=Streptomyces zagrosensis TaxID=1042984 RepID=A0A7W9QAV7_9ACTN|nr:anti-sigma factor (TIGR02949 family) [Streptomyces zagrosensis]
MSCGDPHETDCSEVLDHLYEFLDHEMPDGDCAKFEVHIDECSPCLEKYGLEQAVKKLVKRCCGHDDVPADLRSKVMGRIELIRSGQAVPDQAILETGPGASVHGGGPKAAPRESGTAETDAASASDSAAIPGAATATAAASAPATAAPSTSAQTLGASATGAADSGAETAARD